MSRPLRLEFPGAIWHVTSRGNERRDIYRDDIDRRRFLGYLARVVSLRRWRLHAWVLMSNHYHLLLETPEVGLSRGMKWLNQKYAEAFNTRHQRVGHLFQGRFHGVLVEREGHLLELLRYLVLNPVRAQLVRFAGDYAWSNYRATAGLQSPPPWLDVDWTLRQFADDHDAYRQFVADARGTSYNPWEEVVGQIYLGGSTFCDRMQELVDAKKRSREHPAPQRSLVRPELDQIAARVAEAFEVTPGALREKSRGHARKALVQLAVEEGGLTAHGVAGWMRASDVAVSRLGYVARKLYAQDRAYRERIDWIRASLS